MTTMANHIERQCEEVRTRFFPLWDRRRKWSLRILDDLDGAHGRCDLEARAIEILGSFKGERATLVLIHEIVHAVVGPGHGQRWQARIEKAATDADRIGEDTLAVILREEVANYRSSPIRLTAKAIYDEIQDAVFDTPQAEFMELIDWVRRQWGLSRPKFLKLFRRSRPVYDQARRDVDGWARAQAALVGRTGLRSGRNTRKRLRPLKKSGTSCDDGTIREDKEETR